MLHQLRQNESSPVVEDLEWELGDQLYSLAQHFKAETLADVKEVRILKAAANYKSEHPFTTGDAERDGVIQALLTEAQARASASGKP